MQTVSEAVTEAARQNPDLASYYKFQRTLLQILNQTRAEISGTLEMVDEEALQTRLVRGLPLLSFAQLPIEAQRFAELISTIAQLLRDYDPDLAEPVPHSPAECLTLAQQRFGEGQAHGEKDGESEEITLA